MKDSPELLKHFANEVAKLMSDGDGRRACNLLQSMGFLNAQGRENEKQTSRSTNGADQVGIWERKPGMTHFVRRRDKLEEWPFWANVSRIEPKNGDKLRIVLLGESVARGFLYDPKFTPAMVLEKILQAQLGHHAVEVVDLARTDLSFELRELARSAVMLEPDAVVVFAANNWDASFSRTADVPSLYSALIERGVAGCKLFFEQKLREAARALVGDVVSTFEGRNVPLLWMIPEFNLGDWIESSENVPHLRQGDIAQWIKLSDEARQALADQDLERAEVLANQVVQMDEGASRAGLYILAEVSRRKGDLKTCRHYLEAARDAHIWERSQIISPRSYGVSQDVLRSAMGHNVVDVPRLFAEYLDGGIPDRRLFLDYCHLTSEGIQVAMAAAASRLLYMLKGSEIGWLQLLDHTMVPSPQVEAEAAFIAAVHCAHYGQPEEILISHCQRAIRLWPEIGKIMKCFMDFQSRRTPLLMCRSAEELAGIASTLVQQYLFHMGKQRLDQRMLDAIAAALKSAGEDVSEQLANIRAEEQKAAGGKTNLLDYYYCSSSAQPLDTVWVLPLQQQLTGSDYFRAHWWKSRFIFVGRTGVDASLTLTCRVCDPGPGSPTIGVEVNGRLRLEVPASTQWETWNIQVPADLLVDGVNEICISWPDPDNAGAQALARTAKQILEGTFTELFCIFGEIHSFTAAQPFSTANQDHELARAASQ
jgi:hypothetical protein